MRHLSTRITPRERQVLDLIAHEHSSREIAEQLYVSHETVNSHRKNMMEKLGVKNTAGLVRVAFERGLMRVGQVAMMVLIVLTGNIEAQVTNGTFNYEVEATGARITSGGETGTEQPAMLLAACHDTDGSNTKIIANEYSGTTSTCGTSIICKSWDADCSEGCWHPAFYDKLLNVSDKSTTTFDFMFSGWENDGGGPLCAYDTDGDDDDDRGSTQVLRTVRNFVSSSSTWSAKQGFTNSINNMIGEIRVAWRYHNGDDKNNALDFGELNTFTKTHTNANRANPSGADNNIGYTSKWTGGSGIDVFYKFTVPTGGRKVIISKGNSAQLWLRLLDASTNGTNNGVLFSTTGSISRQLCAGVYYVVVEGTNSANQLDFTLSVNPEPIDISAGTINTTVIGVCENDSIGAVLSTGSAISNNLGVTYKWFKRLDGEFFPGTIIPNATGPSLTAAQAGIMPGVGMYIQRGAEVCGGNIVYSTSKRIDLTSSSIDPGSIDFVGNTKTIPTSATPATNFTIPAVSDGATYTGYFDSGKDANDNFDNSSGSPGPITTTYQLKAPGEDDWLDVKTVDAVGFRWTPNDDNDNPFLSTGLYKVRRKAENSCGNSELSNVIDIIVQDDLGSISGTVNTPQQSPVIGATVTAVRITPVEGGTYTPDTYQVTTGSNGYTIPNIYFGSDTETAKFVVTPSFVVNGTIHEFSNERDTVILQKSPSNLTNVNFTDNTSLSISGRVAQTLIGQDIPVCGMDTVTILVDGVPQDSTDADGYFNISVSSPGDYTITAQYKNLEFDLNYSGSSFGAPLSINQNITNFDFEATTMHTISGKITDGCGEPIGEATVRIQDFNGCWTKDIETMNNGFFSEVTLPARAYKIFVVKHTDEKVNNFFAAAQYVDLTERDTSDYLIKYRAQPVITLSGLPEVLDCSNQYNGIPNMEQLGIYAYEINVHELALDNDTDPNNVPPVNTCLLDTGTIEIIDDIGDRGLVQLQFTNGKAFDTIITGGPNLIAPHLKKMAILAQDTVANTLDSEVVELDALVTGARSTASNFDLVTPELPMMILRDPPGDGSYAFVEQEQTHEVSTAMYSLKGGSDNKWGNVRIGTQFEAGFIGFDVETQIWNDQTLEITHGSRNTSTTESVETTTVSSRFQTSDSDLIVGGDGDLIIGASMVMNYSTADIVSLDGCAVELSKELIVAPKGVKTQYFLRTGFIRDVTIPSLEYKVENPPNPDSIPFYVDQVKIWKNILLYNDSLKNEAVPFDGISSSDNSGIPENLTLSDNALVEYSVTSSSSKVFTTEFVTEIDKDIANEIGLEIAGIGASGGYLINMKTEKGETNTSLNTTTFTSGFSLFDDDVNDGFNISVLSDPVFKTPVFVLNSGQTSCPWEPGTQKRDDPQLIAVDPIQANIPDGTVRTFNFKLGNVSETSEDREYRIQFINESNSGARIEFENNVGQDYNVGSGTEANVKVNVSQFSNPSNEYSFEGLEFEAVPTCEAEEEISDKALISAFYMSPCTDVNLAVPGDNWVINSMMTTIPIKINGYTKAGLTEIQLEYLEVGTYDWTNAIVIPAANLLDNDPDGINLGTTLQYNASNLPDGNYYLRLKAVCSGGINNYSMRVQGVKDTKAPAILGLPMPADDIFDTNDDLIGTQFDESVKSLSTSNTSVEFIRLDNANNNMGSLPATLGLFGNTASIVPQQFLIGGNILPGAYRVVLNGIEDDYGNVAEPMSWVFITPGYVLDDGCSVLDIANNNNNQDAISVSNYRAISITSDGMILGAGTTSYLASEDVGLLDNFEVSAGGEFIADIYPCDDDLCEDVTSSAGKGDAPGEFLRWQIVEEGDCVKGIYFDNATPPSADIEVDVNQFVGTNSDTVAVQLRMGAIQKDIELTASGATVSLGRYVSGGGTLYGVEAILTYIDNRDATGKIVVAIIEMKILPPDTTPPILSINPITGDDVVDAIEVFSPVEITGTTDAEDFQNVTVTLNGNSYNGLVNMGVWSVTLPSNHIQALALGSINVTADVTDFVGNPATQASRTLVRDDNSPTQYPISGISYYDELMDPSFPGPSSPPGEDMSKLIDGDTLTKFLSFDQSYFDDLFFDDVFIEGTIEVVLDLTTQETPSWLSVTTANDEPDRDPKVLHILGSNDGFTFDNLGSAIPISCGTDRFATRVYEIDNTTPYQFYVVRFLDQCNSNANSMQLAEIALWGN